MEKTAVLFDLDDTLLPMDYQKFIRVYLELLAAYAAPMGYQPKPLTDALWDGVAAVVKNDGSRTNFTAFWETMIDRLGNREKIMQDIPAFDRFYSHEFDRARSAASPNPLAAQAVRLAHSAADAVILATMPVFPRAGIATRLNWIGLTPEDFDDITTYENSSFSKPNPAYFSALLKKHGIRPEKALMIGNDVNEDILAAQAAGISTYLVTDRMIPGKAEPDTPQGSFRELLSFLETYRFPA